MTVLNDYDKRSAMQALDGSWTHLHDRCREIARQLQGGPMLDEHGAHVRYLSTGCAHGKHDYCQSMTGLAGAKRPGQCKWCEARCVCWCHRVGTAPGAVRVRSAEEPAEESSPADVGVVDGDILRDLIADCLPRSMADQAAGSIADEVLDGAVLSGMTVLHGPDMQPRRVPEPGGDGTDPAQQLRAVQAVLDTAWLTPGPLPESATLAQQVQALVRDRDVAQNTARARMAAGDKLAAAAEAMEQPHSAEILVRERKRERQQLAAALQAWRRAR